MCAVLCRQVVDANGSMLPVVPTVPKEHVSEQRLSAGRLYALTLNSLTRTSNSTWLHTKHMTISASTEA